jgi:hypothetical protein
LHSIKKGRYLPLLNELYKGIGEVEKVKIVSGYGVCSHSGNWHVYQNRRDAIEAAEEINDEHKIFIGEFA